MTRFHVDGEWIELDELIEGYQKWNRFIGNPLIQLEANKQADFLVECYNKFEATINKVKEWNLTHHRDKHAASSILMDLERMLGLEGKE